FVTEQLEPRLVAAGQTPPFRGGAVFGADALGVSTNAQTLKTLKFNGKTVAENQVDGNFLAVNAGDLVDTLHHPNPQGKIGAAVAAMFQFKPHIILHEYAPALISKVLFSVEGGWTTATAPGTPLPYHIGHQSFFNGFGPLFPFLTGGNATHRNGRFFAVQ